jgi:acetyl esterase
MKIPLLLVMSILPVSAISQTAPVPEADGPSSIRTYKTVGEKSLSLHFFEPAGTASPDSRPCVILLHSGGWSKNGPESYYRIARSLRDMGFVVACAQYRLANAPSTVLDAVADTRDAMRYLRANAKDLRIDLVRIVACGGSAGGHLAASLALFPEATGAKDAETLRPAALVLLNPVIDTSPEGYGNEKIGKDWRALSPLHQVKANTPPTIIFHGTGDRTTPFAGSKAFHAAMLALGNRCELHPHEGGDHGYYRDEPIYSQTMTEIRRFCTALEILPSAN